ncbi:hypothetical protein [Helicobacter equorum]|uniref:hypothetical protein n=1 Tax=Helicobacter equorum TaxID=361872 RepID=UPI000CF17FA6|nr:hypothetical protein [Helicobacter equorum]
MRIDIDQSLKWVLKNQKRKNYLTISTDVGLGFADGRMESISLAPYGYSNFLTLDSLSLGLVVPITIRAGYTREFNNKSWSLGINTLYIMGNVGGIESETSYSYPDRYYSCYDNGCPTTIKDNRIGRSSSN